MEEPCVYLLGTMALKTKTINPAKMKFDGKKLPKIDAVTVSSDKNVNKSKHIIFDDDDKDGGVAIPVEKKQAPKKSEKSRKEAIDIGTQWYQTVCIQLFMLKLLGDCEYICFFLL